MCIYIYMYVYIYDVITSKHVDDIIFGPSAWSLIHGVKALPTPQRRVEPR